MAAAFSHAPDYVWVLQEKAVTAFWRRECKVSMVPHAQNCHLLHEEIKLASGHLWPKLFEEIL